jgi:hypothetical protein
MYAPVVDSISLQAGTQLQPQTRHSIHGLKRAASTQASEMLIPLTVWQQDLHFHERDAQSQHALRTAVAAGPATV